MPRPASQADPSPLPARPDRAAAEAEREYPVREYIAGLSIELARMARWDEDERLAILLEAAAARATEPRAGRPPIETVEPVARPS
ncbi:MAG: hypothetical protein EBR82_07520 [Caulobacteraceae bacterium]|nr:hypothetical protein [Caulobacteraceae bacterium]